MKGLALYDFTNEQGAFDDPIGLVREGVSIEQGAFDESTLLDRGRINSCQNFLRPMESACLWRRSTTHTNPGARA